MIDTIKEFPSATQAVRNATMIGAYDPVTGIKAIGNAKITSEALDPRTVQFVESKLGVMFEEVTKMCTTSRTGTCV